MVNKWENVLIGDFLTFKNGLNKEKEFFGTGTPIINYTDVYNHRALSSADIKGKVTLSKSELARYEVRKNDVFFTRTSETPEEVGLAAVLIDDILDCTFSGFVLRGRPKNDLFVPEYCRYCFSTKQVRREIVLNCTYTTRALTNGTQLSLIEIPHPLKDEQIAIANALVDVDELIHTIELTIKKKKDLRIGTIQHFFNVDALNEWFRYPVAENFDFCKGNTLSRDKLNYSFGAVKNIHYGDVLVKYGDNIDVSSEIVPFVNPEAYPMAVKGDLLQNGDIVLADTAEDNSVGKVTEVVHADKIKCVSGLHTICLRPHAGIFASGYLGYFMNSSVYHNQLIPYIQGIKVSSISKQAIKETVVYAPEIEKQKEVVSILTDMDKEIDALADKLQKYYQIKQGMMLELLTGNIRLI